MIDLVTYKAQLKACKMTGGIVPHPAFVPLKSPTGFPMTNPMEVCLLGRPAKPAQPPMPIRPPSPSTADFSGDAGSNGLVDSIASTIADFRPFAVSGELCERLVDARRWFRSVTAILVALVFLGGASAWPWMRALVADLPGSYAPWIPAACGAIVGWIVPSLLGWLIILVLRIIVYSIALVCAIVYGIALVVFVVSVTAAILTAVYVGICLLNGHHPF